MNVSTNVFIMTKNEFEEAAMQSFRRGVQKGRFEESYDRVTDLVKSEDVHLFRDRRDQIDNRILAQIKVGEFGDLIDWHEVQSATAASRGMEWLNTSTIAKSLS